MRIGQRADRDNPFLHGSATGMSNEQLEGALRDGELDALHWNARQNRGLLIAADRKDIAAKLRPPQSEAGQQSEHQHVKHWVGNAKDPCAAAQRKQLCLVGTELKHDRVVRHDRRDASRDRQHPQRHHERRETEICDQDAIESPNGERSAQRGADSDDDYFL